MRRFYLCACLLAALTFGVATPATALASPAGPATVAKKKKKKVRCTLRAVAKGKRACFKLRAPCVRRARPLYLRRKLDCRKRRLVRASPAAIRGGRLIALPSSGIPTFSQAKDLFDQVVADLPGVNPRKGSIGTTASGTSAILSLVRYDNRLTDAQKGVLAGVLTPSADSTTIHVDQDGNVVDQPPPESPPPAVRASGLKEDFDAIVREAIPRLQAKGVTLDHDVTISVQGESPARGDLANASPQWLLGTGNTCQINVYAPANNASTDFKRQIMLHELTHCSQFKNMNAGNLTKPVWVVDGTADYVAYNLIQEWIGGVPNPSWWPVYLRTNPTADLFTRTYDALGFWSLLAQKGVNVYTLIPSLVRQGDNSAGAYAIATAQADSSYRNEWGTTLAKRSAFGVRWNLQGAGAPSPNVPGTTIGNDSFLPLPVSRRGASVLAFDAKADIVRIGTDETLAGWLRLGNGSERKLGGTMFFCNRSKGCACPGKPDNTEKLPKGIGYLGFAGPDGAGEVTLSGQKFDAKNCDKEEDGSGNPPKRLPRRGGGIEIRRSTEEDPEPRLIGRITSGSCGFAGKSFKATGQGSGFKFAMRIGGAKRTGLYHIPYGSKATYVKITGFSSLNAPPRGLSGPSSVDIRSFRVRKVIRYRISVGFSPLFNSSLSSSVTLNPAPGGLVC